jgi:hypothetical protein
MRRRRRRRRRMRMICFYEYVLAVVFLDFIDDVVKSWW